MIRKIFAGLMLILCAQSNAQEGSASPYSFFGIGELRFRGVVENQMMGGISVFADSTALSLKNPANYSSMQLTTYTVGASYTSLGLKTEETEENAEIYSFDYLALGFPIGKKGGVGFGIVPFTSVGYQLSSLDESQELSTLDRFSGEGGVNRVFVSAGYKITKNISFGATMNYDFGKIENRVVRFTDEVQLGTRETNRSTLRGLDFNLALNYKGKVSEKLTGYASLLFSPEADLSSENERQFSTLTIIRGVEVPVETVDINLSDLGLNKTDLTLPATTSVGLGIGANKKWFLGAEYELKKTSNFDNPFLSITNVAYEDATRFSIGGFYIPQYNSFSNYWKRVVYRAGLRYEETGIRINNLPVNDFGMSFGLGLPVGLSKINLGFEVGRRGTTSAQRIEENYFNVNLSLSLLDKWFQKNKYQ
ncbi:hypothetical protein [Ascidiimonas sp. W6]|uniref:hypothetical protein n=1 Tax=Ascidiimonas meishanensis TaxID=3128903 RepID=UPI0030EF8CF9